MIPGAPPAGITEVVRLMLSVLVDFIRLMPVSDVLRATPSTGDPEPSWSELGDCDMSPSMLSWIWRNSSASTGLLLPFFLLSAARASLRSFSYSFYRCRVRERGVGWERRESVLNFGIIWYMDILICFCIWCCVWMKYAYGLLGGKSPWTFSSSFWRGPQIRCTSKNLKRWESYRNREWKCQLEEMKFIPQKEADGLILYT